MSRLKTTFRRIIKGTIKTTGINKLIYAIIAPFVSQKFYGNAEQAHLALNQFSSCPHGTSLTKNNIAEYEYDLQIIIPAYNVERYIEECIDSILEQKTKYSYKIFIINDGSTDKTKEILERYTNNSKIEIIHQDNKGFSGARNKGLETIKAKYIAFVDSDDKLAAGAIEGLLNTATTENADIVEGGFYRLDNELTVEYKHKKTKKVDATSYLKGYPCGKVFNSLLFSNIRFPENFWFEDSIGAFLLYPQAISAFVIPDMVYIYRNNLTSISHTALFKKKSIDTYWVTELLLSEQQQLNITKTETVFENFLKQIVLNYKRTKKMPENIQKHIFICTKDLLKKHFDNQSIKKYARLIVALKNSDFGKYKYFCELFLA